MPEQSRPSPSPSVAGESLARALLAVRRIERTLSRLEEAVERRGFAERGQRSKRR
jgi:hypothetical protein